MKYALGLMQHFTMPYKTSISICTEINIYIKAMPHFMCTYSQTLNSVWVPNSMFMFVPPYKL